MYVMHTMTHLYRKIFIDVWITANCSLVVGSSAIGLMPIKLERTDMMTALTQTDSVHALDAWNQ